jgi:hypothetical protein
MKNVPKIKTEKLLLFIGGTAAWLALAYLVLTIAFDLISRCIRWLSDAS